jgi:ABC-type tungstate transport system substrate-binding protein
LEGVDQILINLAHKSFDIMLAGAIIGAVVGVVLAYIIKK